MIHEISRKYARALYEKIGNNASAQVAQAELAGIAKIIGENTDLKKVLSSPVIGISEKKSVLAAALDKNASADVVAFLNLLSEKRRLDFLGNISEALAEICDLNSGVTRGEVLSATELASDYRAELEKQVSRITNKKVMLSYRTDPNILGGVTVRLGGLTINDSAAYQLKKLNEELNRS